MDDLQSGVRLAGLYPLPRRAGGNGECVHPATPQSAHDPVEAAFEHELAVWLARLYATRGERVLIRRLKRVCRLCFIAATLIILTVPWFGVTAALTAAAVSVAALALAVKTARPCPGLPDGLSWLRGRQPLDQGNHPVFGTDERAQLVRVMNLSRAAWRPATRMRLRADLREARSCGSLANWEALYDLEDLVLDNTFASTAISE